MYMITFERVVTDGWEDTDWPNFHTCCVTMGEGRPKFYRTWLGAWFDVGTLRSQHPHVVYVIHKVSP